jgi:hypothetical protein
MAFLQDPLILIISGAAIAILAYTALRASRKKDGDS